MNKITRNLIIGIGVASILVSIYGFLNGQKFLEVIGGVVIGASIIGSVLIRKKDIDKNHN